MLTPAGGPLLLSTRRLGRPTPSVPHAVEARADQLVRRALARPWKECFWAEPLHAAYRHALLLETGVGAPCLQHHGQFRWQPFQPELLRHLRLQRATLRLEVQRRADAAACVRAAAVLLAAAARRRHRHVVVVVMVRSHAARCGHG